MIYIVTGYMRTGSSMMMQSLIAGGLEPEYDKRREHMNDTFGDDLYKPNPDGFYELAYPEYEREGFPLMYEGKLIKALRGALPLLAPHDYKMVFMIRNPEEIRQSYEGFFRTGADMWILQKYYERMQQSIDYVRSRGDTDLVVFRYRDVVEEPKKHFEILESRGWPIDVDKAAACVKPELCRFRIEKLVVGL